MTLTHQSDSNTALDLTTNIKTSDKQDINLPEDLSSGKVKHNDLVVVKQELVLAPIQPPDPDMMIPVAIGGDVIDISALSHNIIVSKYIDMITSNTQYFNMQSCTLCFTLILAQRAILQKQQPALAPEIPDVQQNVIGQ